MKVLLCRDVEKLGWLGDVVEVNDGYARNYLLPHRLAVVPTEANVKSLAEAKAKAATQRQLAQEQLSAVVEAVNGAEAVITAKANEQGRLFGSVTGRSIAENLRAQGFEVPDEAIDSTQHIKEVGEHEITLKFAGICQSTGLLTEELTAKVNVVVVAEGKEIEESNEDSEKEGG